MNIEGKPGELRATIHVTRKATGKIETYEVIGTTRPTYDAFVRDGNNGPIHISEEIYYQICSEGIPVPPIHMIPNRTVKIGDITFIVNRTHGAAGAIVGPEAKVTNEE